MADQANAVNEEVAAEPTATDSAPVENNSEVADLEDFGDEGWEDGEEVSESEEDEQETEETEPSEKQEAQEQPQGKAEERKQQLNTEIRDLISKRNDLRQQVEQMNSQVYQPASEQELQEQGFSPEMAAIEAMKQERELERYNNQVAEAQLTLSSEASRALQDFPQFDAESPEYNPQLAAQVDELLGANIVTDPNTGQVIGSRVSPYKLYQSFANAMKVSAAQGQVDGQRSTERMLASADATGSAHKSEKTDAQLEGFDEEAGRW